MGWQTAWVSEIDPYASAVLKKHWPNAPNLGDITKITNPPPVDILVGGFPCQDISVAGKGEGIGGSRSGLWKEYARIIGEITPRWVVIENSPRLRALGLGVVLKDLMALGYDAEWHCIPAAYVGAPHRRDRIWIVAYPHSARLQGHAGNGGTSGRQGAAGHTTSCGLRDGAGEVRDTTGPRLQVRPEVTVGQPASDAESERSAWWTTEPNVGRVAHGVPSRVDRIKCCGNAIVPKVVYEIFKAIAREEDTSST